MESQGSSFENFKTHFLTCFDMKIYEKYDRNLIKPILTLNSL